MSDDNPVKIGNSGTVAVGTLTNYGTIFAPNGIYPGAIGVYSGSSVTAIFNAVGASVISNRTAIDNEGGTIGTITNSGLLSGSRYVILNEQGTIESIWNTFSGQMIGTSDRAEGISNNGTVTGSITNDGLIQNTSTTLNDYPGTPEANPVGILNYGSVGSIINNGTIISTGTANGMGIENTATVDVPANYASIGMLINAGTITVDSSSNTRDPSQGYAVGIENTYGTIGILTNSGTITSTGYTTPGHLGANAYGIDNYRSITTLNNIGTITAAIGSGNTDGYGYGIFNRRRATIATINNSGTITSHDYGIYNWGTIGTLTNSGTITGGQFGINSLYQSGYSTAATIGSITNTGTISGGLYGISLATATTLTNTGTISGGTAAVDFAAGGNTLNIYNSARFIGGVNFEAKGSNTLNFYTGSYTLPVQNYLLTGAGNAINLLGSGKTLITNDLNGSGTGNIVVVDTAAVGTLDHVTADVQRQVSGVITDIMNLNVDRPTSLLPPSTTPTAYGEEDRKTNAASIVIKNSPDQALALDNAGNLFWLRGFYGGRWQDANGATVATSARQYGTLTGVDHLYEDWRLGAYGGVGHTTTWLTDGTGNLDANMALAGLYARHSFSNFLTFDTALTAGHLWADTTRSINSGTESAIGSFNGWFVAPEAALSLKYVLDPHWTLTPSLRTSYVATFYDGYSEHGSSQNVSYDGHTTQSLEERFETQIAYQTMTAANQPSRYWLGLGASSTQRIGTAGYGATVSGADFTVAALGNSVVYGGSMTVGFDVMLNRQTSLFGSVEGQLFSDRSRSAIGRFGIKVAF
ncbi:MAG: autotransporter outer membrane beta-barrel domain-containing protein [Ancalomicrobiaceae bacterium]|nr:autotransporter outer membrane beta-barrel domain-containing protein [Ancalomicrobiaceae bacterium]